MQRTQRVVQVDGAIYISGSNGDDPGEFFARTPGGPAEMTSSVPKGPGDLTYDERTEEIFTATEHPGLRVIVWRNLYELQLFHQQ